MKTKMKEIVGERTGRNALRGEIMTGRQEHRYELGGKIRIQPKDDGLITDIEQVLGKNGFRRFRQLGLPGEFKAVYMKGKRIITVSDVPEALNWQILAIKNMHQAILKMQMEEERRKEKSKEKRNHRKKREKE